MIYKFLSIFFLILMVSFGFCVDITDCNYTISAPGTYDLLNDINTVDGNVTANNACISIMNSAVTLDCHDHVISGTNINDGNIAIYLGTPENGLTIQNCKITNIGLGLEASLAGPRDDIYGDIISTDFYDLNKAINLEQGDFNLYDVNFTNIDFNGDTGNAGFLAESTNLVISNSYIGSLYDAEIYSSTLSFLSSEVTGSTKFYLSTTTADINSNYFYTIDFDEQEISLFQGSAGNIDVYDNNFYDVNITALSYDGFKQIVDNNFTDVFYAMDNIQGSSDLNIYNNIFLRTRDCNESGDFTGGFIELISGGGTIQNNDMNYFFSGDPTNDDAEFESLKVEQLNDVYDLNVYDNNISVTANNCPMCQMTTVRLYGPAYFNNNLITGDALGLSPITGVQIDARTDNGTNGSYLYLKDTNVSGFDYDFGMVSSTMGNTLTYDLNVDDYNLLLENVYLTDDKKAIYYNGYFDNCPEAMEDLNGEYGWIGVYHCENSELNGNDIALEKNYGNVLVIDSNNITLHDLNSDDSLYPSIQILGSNDVNVYNVSGNGNMNMSYCGMVSDLITNAFIQIKDSNNVSLTGALGIENYCDFFLLDDSNNVTMRDSVITRTYYPFFVGPGATQNNFIYNNHFVSDVNGVDISSHLDGNYPDLNLSTTESVGENIFGGPNMGGNYWELYGDENGFSETCTDADFDGFCDEEYDMGLDFDLNAGYYVDYLPLTTVGQNGTQQCPGVITDANFENLYTFVEDVNFSENCFEFSNIHEDAETVTIDCQGNTITAIADNSKFISLNGNMGTIEIVNCDINLTGDDVYLLYDEWQSQYNGFKFIDSNLLAYDTNYNLGGSELSLIDGNPLSTVIDYNFLGSRIEMYYIASLIGGNYNSEELVITDLNFVGYNSGLLLINYPEEIDLNIDNSYITIENEPEYYGEGVINFNNVYADTYVWFNDTNIDLNNSYVFSLANHEDDELGGILYQYFNEDSNIIADNSRIFWLHNIRLPSTVSDFRIDGGNNTTLLSYGGMTSSMVSQTFTDLDVNDCFNLQLLEGDAEIYSVTFDFVDNTLLKYGESDQNNNNQSITMLELGPNVHNVYIRDANMIIYDTNYYVTLFSYDADVNKETRMVLEYQNQLYIDLNGANITVEDESGGFFDFSDGNLGYFEIDENGDAEGAGLYLHNFDINTNGSVLEVDGNTAYLEYVYLFGANITAEGVVYQFCNNDTNCSYDEFVIVFSEDTNVTFNNDEDGSPITSDFDLDLFAVVNLDATYTNCMMPLPFFNFENEGDVNLYIVDSNIIVNSGCSMFGAFNMTGDPQPERNLDINFLLSYVTLAENGYFFLTFGAVNVGHVAITDLNLITDSPIFTMANYYPVEFGGPGYIGDGIVDEINITDSNIITSMPVFRTECSQTSELSMDFSNTTITPNGLSQGLFYFTPNGEGTPVDYNVINIHGFNLETDQNDLNLVDMNLTNISELYVHDFNFRLGNLIVATDSNVNAGNIYDNYLIDTNEDTNMIIVEGSTTIDDIVTDFNAYWEYETNVLGGNYGVGNYWTNVTGDGLSDTCTDDDEDGVCNEDYDVDTGVWIDYMPLSSWGVDLNALEFDVNALDVLFYDSIDMNLHYQSDGDYNVRDYNVIMELYVEDEWVELCSENYDENLNVGDDAYTQCAYDLTPLALAGGEYPLRGRVMSIGQIDKVAINDTITLTLTVYDNVDLNGDSLVLSSSSVAPSAEVIATFTYGNDGDVTADANYTVSIYRSGTLIVDCNEIITTDLNAGDVNTYECTFSAPATAGTYTVTGIVDYNSYDSDNDNNSASATLTVTSGGGDGDGDGDGDGSGGGSGGDGDTNDEVNHAPVVNITRTSIDGNNATIYYYAYDEDKDTLTYSVKLDSRNFTTTTNTVSYTFYDLSLGQHSLTVKTTDEHGLYAYDSNTITITIITADKNEIVDENEIEQNDENGTETESQEEIGLIDTIFEMFKNHYIMKYYKVIDVNGEQEIYVYDEHKNFILGADVIISNENASYKGETDFSGLARFRILDQGTYDIEVKVNDEVLEGQFNVVKGHVTTESDFVEISNMPPGYAEMSEKVRTSAKVLVILIILAIVGIIGYKQILKGNKPKYSGLDHWKHNLDKKFEKPKHETYKKPTNLEEIKEL